MKTFEGEVSFHDPGGLHTGPQDILLSRDVTGIADPVQVVQVAEGVREKDVI